MSESVSSAVAPSRQVTGAGPRVRVFRRQAQRFLRRLICKPATELADEDLCRSAIVFAPHFDDETLGCGGTIAKKKALGADVTIAFMTDGTGSHAGMMAADELAAVRKAEGYAAARVLGVDAHDVHAFGFTDSKLSAHADEAIRRVGELLRSTRPRQAFLPYQHDRLADHMATHRIVTSAMEASGMTFTVYEYPIWYWQHWPWVSMEHLPRRSWWTAMRESIRSTVGLLRERRCRAGLSDAEQRKKYAALAEHRSQTTRLLQDAQWPILSDVWDGDFLACCFQKQEIFVRREVRPRR